MTNHKLLSGLLLAVVAFGCNHVVDLPGQEIAIQSVYPLEVPAGQTNEFFVVGAGFDADTEVRVDGESMTNSFVPNDGVIRFTASLERGRHELALVASDGTIISIDEPIRAFAANVGFQTTTPIVDQAGLVEHHMADLDGDGFDDIVASDGTTIFLFRRVTPARFEPFGSVPFSASSRAQLSRSQDINGDGRADILHSDGIYLMTEMGPGPLLSFELERGGYVVSYGRAGSVVRDVLVFDPDNVHRFRLQGNELERVQTKEFGVFIEDVQPLPSTTPGEFDDLYAMSIEKLIRIDGDTLDVSIRETALIDGYASPLRLFFDVNDDGQLDLVVLDRVGINVVFGRENTIYIDDEPISMTLPCGVTRAENASSTLLKFAVECDDGRSLIVQVLNEELSYKAESLPDQWTRRATFGSLRELGLLDATVRTVDGLEAWYAINHNRSWSPRESIGLSSRPLLLASRYVQQITGRANMTIGTYYRGTTTVRDVFVAQFAADGSYTMLYQDDWNRDGALKSLDVCDANGDGLDDIIGTVYVYDSSVNQADDSRVLVRYQKPDGTFSELDEIAATMRFGDPLIPGQGGHWPTARGVGDFDGDGDCDYYWVNRPRTGARQAVLLRQTDQGFVPSLSPIPSSGEGTMLGSLWKHGDGGMAFLAKWPQPSLVNISEDGELSITPLHYADDAVHTHDFGDDLQYRMYVLPLSRTPNTTRLWFAWVGPDTRAFARVASINRNGLLNVGPAFEVGATPGQPRGAVCADVDGDGDRELLLSLNETTHVLVRAGVDGEISIDREPFVLDAPLTNLHFSDIDADGLPDLVGSVPTDGAVLLPNISH